MYLGNLIEGNVSVHPSGANVQVGENTLVDRIAMRVRHPRQLIHCGCHHSDG